MALSVQNEDRTRVRRPVSRHLRPPERSLLLLVSGLVCSALGPAWAAECAAPTRQAELRPVAACSNALCCPRELDLQINLVKAVAAKLKSMGYTVKDAESTDDEAPDVRGIYSPKSDSAMRTAMRKFKKDKNLADPGDEISYSFVKAVLGVDLFERWKTR